MLTTAIVVSAPCPRSVGARLLDQTPLRHVLLVIDKIRREYVAARPVGDEIEIAGLGRIERRFNRGAAGIGDRRRRQAKDAIGVVACLKRQLALPDSAL